MFKKLFTIIIIFNLILISFLASASEYLSIENKLKDYRYVMDEVEYFQSPEETIKRKKGDCEDFAILTDYWLEQLNYKSEMYVIFFEEVGHAITVFEDKKGIYRIFSNTNLLYYSSDNLLTLLLNYTASFKDSETGKFKSIYIFNPHKYGKIRNVRKSLGKKIYSREGGQS